MVLISAADVRAALEHLYANVELAQTPLAHSGWVVEDNPGVTELYQRYLHGSGWRAVFLAQPGETAQAASELRPDAVLLDVLMPTTEAGRLARSVQAAMALVLEDALTQALARLDSIPGDKQAGELWGELFHNSEYSRVRNEVAALLRQVQERRAIDSGQ